jgi:hypothetical protein
MRIIDREEGPALIRIYLTHYYLLVMMICPIGRCSSSCCCYFVIVDSVLVVAVIAMPSGLLTDIDSAVLIDALACDDSVLVDALPFVDRVVVFAAIALPSGLLTEIDGVAVVGALAVVVVVVGSIMVGVILLFDGVASLGVVSQ